MISSMRVPFGYTMIGNNVIAKVNANLAGFEADVLQREFPGLVVTKLDKVTKHQLLSLYRIEGVLGNMDHRDAFAMHLELAIKKSKMAELSYACDWLSSAIVHHEESVAGVPHYDEDELPF